MQVDVLPKLKSQLAVNDDIDIMRALEIARESLSIRLRAMLACSFKRGLCSNTCPVGDIFDELPCISFAACLGLGPHIVEIPRVVVPDS